MSGERECRAFRILNALNTKSCVALTIYFTARLSKDEECTGTCQARFYVYVVLIWDIVYKNPPLSLIPVQHRKGDTLENLLTVALCDEGRGGGGGGE